MNRSERRAGAHTRYRRVDVTRDCAICGATLGATFVLEPGDPTPGVMFVHLVGGGHEPIISGDSMAARARRNGQIIGQTSADMLDD